MDRRVLNSFGKSLMDERGQDQTIMHGYVQKLEAMSVAVSVLGRRDRTQNRLQAEIFVLTGGMHLEFDQPLIPL